MLVLEHQHDPNPTADEPESWQQQGWRYYTSWLSLSQKRGHPFRQRGRVAAFAFQVRYNHASMEKSTTEGGEYSGIVLVVV